MKSLILALLLVGAATPPATAASAAAKMPKPKPNSVSNAYDVFDNSISRPVARVFDLPRWGRRATGHPREAANVDAADQVRLPSTWWQPRVGFRTVTPQQMLTGPGPGTGPVGRHWAVTHTKDHGVTPGLMASMIPCRVGSVTSTLLKLRCVEMWSLLDSNARR